MIINNTFGFIFVHVPKCAGTTMTNLLSRCSTYNDIEVGGTAMGETIAPYFRNRFGLTKHSTAMEIRRVIGDDIWGRYFSFALVRNPYDRAYSAYKFLQRMRIKDSFLLFRDFVKSDYFLSEGLNRVLMPQLFWIKKNANDTQIGVDYVGRVESIDQTIQQLAIRVPKLSSYFDDIAIPQLNRRSDYGAENLLDLLQDKGVESRIFEKYKIDFETFGYARINGSRLIAHRHAPQESDLRQQVVLKKEATAACITGMHRSGTSMVARLLNICGLYLGGKKALMPANRENPEGYWEHMSFVGLNDQILSKLKAGWDFPPKLSVNWHRGPKFDSHRKKAVALIQSLEQNAPWGWKDPRNCLTIDFWKSLIPDLKVIICIRNPREVVKSLHKRGVSSDAFGFNLWLKYNQTILGSVDPELCIVTHYESYFDDPIGELKRLLNFIGLSASEEQLRTASETIQVSLRRNNVLKPDLPQDVEILYKRLCQKASPMLMKNNKKTDSSLQNEAETNRINQNYERAMEQIRAGKPEGDFEEASSLSKRVLQLDPGNAFATQVLVPLSNEKSSAPVEESSAERDGEVQKGAGRQASETDLSQCCLGGKSPRISTLGDDPKSSDVADRVKSGHTESISEKGANDNVPLVSLIIPVFNNVELTKKCIESIRKNTRYDLYEVIIVDNASTDATLEYLNSLGYGVRIIRNEKNVGFAKACNLGARISERDYLLFLNNDTEAEPLWLDHLLSVFNQEPDAGIVGAKLLYPDRTVQHAGIQFLPLQQPLDLEEFGAINFMPDHPYRYANEAMPAVNVRRELDMICGACILIKASVFKEVGGFDEAYLNGCEDIDLCLKIRQRGLKVIYEPRSVLIHHEGKTQGRYKYVRQNLGIFFSRWAAHFDGNWRFVGCNNLSARNQKSITNNKRIVWEGSQLVRHSLALVNRELCLQLIDAGFDLSIIPYEKDNIGPESDARFEKIIQKTQKRSSDRADVHVRHQWPPDFNAPKAGSWVIMQPWEFGSLPKAWVDIMKDQVDELWVPSSYVRDCFIRSGVPAGKVFVVPNGVDPKLFNPQSTPYTLATKKRFKFLFVGGTLLRKGIDILLDAYMSAFSSADDVCLVIKDMGGNSFYKGQTAEKLIEEYRSVPHAPEIEYIQNMLNEKDMAGLYTACNCLVHPYRGEGFGLPIAEAMSSELPVIVTGYGAALDFCTPGNSYLLPAKEIRFSEKKVGKSDTVDYPWLAEPDRESLKDMMKRAMEHPEEAKKKAKAARARIEMEFTWEKASSAVIRRINELVLKPVVRFNRTIAIKQAAFVPSVSIIIRVSRNLQSVKKCFQNIKKHTGASHEIIFIVHREHTNELKWVKQTAKENENCKYIENSEDIGWAKEINQGIRDSLGDYLLLLDSHAEVPENWLTDLLECINHDQKIGIVGAISDENGHNWGLHHNYPGSGHPAIECTSSFRERNRYRRIPANKISKFCMLFKRKLVDEIGFVDENFDEGNFATEDLCLRASLAGYQNMIAGDVFIKYHGKANFSGKTSEQNRFKANRLIFNEKWYGVDSKQRFGKKTTIVNAVVKADDFYRQGDIGKATAALLEAIKHAPEDRSLYFKLVEMLIDAKLYGDALGILESLPQEDSDDKHLALLGYCEEALGNNDSAQGYVNRALAIEPENIQALNTKGVIAYKNGEKGIAETLFKKAIDVNPSCGESYTNLGSMKWAEGEQMEALNLFERGFILSPTSADAVAAYHNAVVETRSSGRAEPLFREASALQPNDKRLAFLMIALLIQQEKYELAMQEIEKAMIQFGIDDGILSAGLEIRKRIGPLEIDRSKRKKATLCLCMIVKNEEQHLAKCLMSVKPVADEIIVVDTGSTDKTKAIASALGAKVFDFPWTNDFSEARNYSLSKASGDSILVLDADEIISPLDHAPLRSLIQQADKRFAYSMTTRNYTYQVASQNWTANDGKYLQEEAASGWLPSPKVRMFVNDKRIRFVNAVHELVEPTLKDIGIRIKNCSIPVHHYGRLNQDRVLAKGEEYYRLGKKKVLETKGDYKALKELAIQASELEKYAEAISLWENLLKLNPKDGVAHLNLGFAHIKLSQYGQGLISSQKAWELDPNSKEAGLNYAGCELIIGDVKRAIFVLNKLLQTYPDYPPALARLAASHIVNGEREQGLQCLERLRRLRFDCAGVLSKHAQAFLSQSRIEQAIVLLEIGIETNNMNADTQALLEECHRQKEGRIPSEIVGSSGMLPAEAAPGQHA